MLEKVSEVAKKLSETDLEAVCLNNIQQHEEELLDMNRAQLQDSVNRDFEPLGFYKTLRYAEMKGRDTVDLRLTGDFYNAMHIEATEFPVFFRSKDEKTGFLVARYGREIFGLTAPNIGILKQNIIIPACVEAINDALL